MVDKEKKAFWKEMVDLDVPASTLDSSLAFEENPFKKALDRYWSENNFVETQRKMADELKELREAVQSIDNAELVKGFIHDIRSKLTHVYQELALRFSSPH